MKVCKVSCHDRSEVQCSRDSRKRLEKAISFICKINKMETKNCFTGAPSPDCLVLVFFDLSMEELEAMEHESQCVAVCDGTKGI